MLSVPQRLDRLAARLRELALWVERDALFLTEPWRAEWEGGEGALRVGDPWPTLEGVVHFSYPQVNVPPDWPLEETYLDLNVGGESLLTLCYDEEEERFGVTPHHERFPLLARAFSVYTKSVARFEFGVPNPQPRLTKARLVLIDESLESLHRLLTLVFETAKSLPDHEVTPPLLEVAERTLTRLEWPSRTDDYVARTVNRMGTLPIWRAPDLKAHPKGLDDAARETVREARAWLERQLALLRERYPKVGALTLTGHAHLDLAWLWPASETRRKGRRTLYGMLALMRRYPEFRFNQSSAQLFTWLEEDDPALFAKLQDAAAQGGLEPTGAMWLEPDVNMPAGESLVRQLLYGQRFFKSRFGSLHDTAWLPDTFGFSPALPQLLKQAGVTNFFTHKLNWSELSDFPHDLFWWEGLDGSRVLAHSFDNAALREGYNGLVKPVSLLRTWRNYRGKYRHPESLLSVGWGDGGGGTTREMLENARDLAHLPVVPEVRWDEVSSFYGRAHESAAQEPLPVWVGEMYLELHRGTLTTQGRTKTLHRRAENVLVTAEVVSSLAHLLGGPPPDSLEDLWRSVLFTEFHDVLPGSSIREVYEETEAELREVVARAEEITSEKMDAVAGTLVEAGEAEGLLVINPDLGERPLRVTLDASVRGAQETEEGFLLTGTPSIKGLEAAVLLETGEPGPLSVSESHLENTWLRVTFAPDGSLARVFDKEAGRDVLAGRGNQLWVYVDKPRNWDAWDVDIDYRAQGEEVTGLESLEPTERGPHRAALRIKRRFRDSSITQEVRLWANSRRLEFKTTLDWRDRRRFLKALFPLNIRATEAAFECAFGLVKRPTHQNTPQDAARFEVPVHRFALLAEPRYGAALLNNGKYGMHALGNELGLSLLRSPVYPDYAADEGAQTFTYALLPLPDEGEMVPNILAEAADLNRPLIARAVRAAKTFSFRAVEVEGLPLGLGSLKAPEEGGGLVLRAYEPQGARGEVRFTLPGGWTVREALDGLERPVEKPGFHFAPFEVRSWRLRKNEDV